MFQGIVERMTHGTNGVGSSHDEDQGGCSDSVWIGGFILSSLRLWTSEGEYGIWPLRRPKDVFVRSPFWRATLRSNSFLWRLIQAPRFTGFFFLRKICVTVLTSFASS